MGQAVARPEEGGRPSGASHVADMASVPVPPSLRDGAAAAAAGGAGEGAAGAGGTEKRGNESGEGLWVFSDPSRRSRKLEEFYTVPDREMGRGHYGVVRKGVRKSDGEMVAVKTIPKRRAVYVEMLRNEIGILKTVEHPHIVRLYDEFEDERQVHLVFELCLGGELFEPIADQHFRFTERQASRLIRKTLDAVKFCHDRNVVHRDLKPENMLLSTPGVESELKVIDFGLATILKPGEVLTRHVGTPYYIAPEVLEKRYGKSCDLWSVGVIMFTILCGFPPFWGDTEREIYGRVRRGYYAFEGPDWQTRSQHSKDLIQRLLTMNPKRRLNVDEALSHPWIVHEGEVIDAQSRRLVNKLRRYSSFPWLKRLAIAVVAKSLPPSDEVYSRDVFESFDLNEEQVITIAELKSSLRQRHLNASDAELQALLTGLDLNRDNFITFTEFSAAVMPRLHYLNERRIFDVFLVLDVDHDGVISMNDLLLLVGDEDFAATTLIESDIDGDGVISFDDFVSIMTGNEAHIL